MGKGNRSRTDRATSTLNAAAPKATAAAAAKKTDTTIKIVSAGIALLLVFFIALSVITSTGILNTISTAAKSNNYRVDANLLSYFYNSEAQSYLQYASYMGIDTSKRLSEQTVSGSSGTTWADSIMSSVKNEVNQLIVLCEAADAAGHKLSDEEKKSIDDQIASIKKTATTYGYTLKAFLKAVYGKGMSESLLRKALTIQTLASSYYSVINKETTDSVTDEEITKYFSEHETDFLTSDVFRYIYTAKLDTGDKAEANDADKEAYKKKQEEMKALADKLGAATSKEDFYKIFTDNAIDMLTEDTFAAKYTYALGKLKQSSNTEIAKMKAEDITAAIAYIREHISDDTITLSDPKVTPADGKTATNEEYYKAAADYARDAVLQGLQKDYHNIEVTKLPYVDPTEKDVSDLNKWLYDKDRKVGDHTSIATTGDTSSSYTAVFVTRTASRDESITRNVAHILFTKDTYKTDDAAKEKAEEILAKYKAGALTLDAFKALGEEYTEDSNVYYENVNEGDMVTEFNDWLFDADRKEGDVEIVKTTYGYHIMYYAGEGVEAWFASAKTAVVNQKISDWTELNAKTYNVTFNDKTLAKVAASY